MANVICMTIMVLIVVIVYFIGIGLYSLFYRKIKPGHAMVTYQKIQGGKDIRIVNVVKGGGRFIMPGTYEFQIFSTGARTATIAIRDYKTSDGKRIHMVLDVLYKIGEDEDHLYNAGMNIINKEPGAIDKIVEEKIIWLVKTETYPSVVYLDRHWDEVTDMFIVNADNVLKEFGVIVLAVHLRDVREVPESVHDLAVLRGQVSTMNVRVTKIYERLKRLEAGTI